MGWLSPDQAGAICYAGSHVGFSSFIFDFFIIRASRATFLGPCRVLSSGRIRAPRRLLGGSFFHPPTPLFPFPTISDRSVLYLASELFSFRQSVLCPPPFFLGIGLLSCAF